LTDSALHTRQTCQRLACYGRSLPPVVSPLNGGDGVGEGSDTAGLADERRKLALSRENPCATRASAISGASAHLSASASAKLFATPQDNGGPELEPPCCALQLVSGRRAAHRHHVKHPPRVLPWAKRACRHRRHNARAPVRNTQWQWREGLKIL
jgi:hypothetical protein